MLKAFYPTCTQAEPLSPRMLSGIPSGVTGVERRALMDAASQAGARIPDR